MSVPLPTITLASPAVGQTFTISVAAMQVSAAPTAPTGPFCKLAIINATGAALDCYAYTAQNVHVIIPANTGGYVTLPPGESSVICTVLATYPQVYTQTVYPYFYGAFETVPDFAASGPLNGSQAGNQARNIALPPGAGLLTKELANPASPSDTNLFSWQPSTTQLAGGVATGYLYALDVIVLELPPAGTNVGVNFQLQLLLKTGGSSGTTVLTNTVLTSTSFVGQGAAGTGAVYAVPYYWPGRLAAGVVGIITNTAFDTAVLNFHITAKVGAPTVEINYQFAADLVNVNTLGPIGFYTINAGAY